MKEDLIFISEYLEAGLPPVIIDSTSTYALVYINGALDGALPDFMMWIVGWAQHRGALRWP